VPRPSATKLELWQRWLRVNRMLIDRLDAGLRDSCAMTLEDYDIIFQLSQRPAGRARMSELADALLLARSSCTRLVGRLEADGLVAREPDTDDRRVVWATLTPKGRKRLRRAAVIHLAGVQQEFTRHIDNDDVAALDALLTRVLSAADVDLA
jgi:DNA-binding MarR family transcriptional regulator